MRLRLVTNRCVLETKRTANVQELYKGKREIISRLILYHKCDFAYLTRELLKYFSLDLNFCFL